MMKVGDIVWFQAYKDHEPIQGCITKFGTRTEIDMFRMDDSDDRIFYELESIKEDRNFVFTRTTKDSLSTTKQSWNKPEI